MASPMDAQPRLWTGPWANSAPDLIHCYIGSQCRTVHHLGSHFNYQKNVLSGCGLCIIYLLDLCRGFYLSRGLEYINQLASCLLLAPPKKSITVSHLAITPMKQELPMQQHFFFFQQTCNCW